MFLEAPRVIPDSRFSRVRLATMTFLVLPSRIARTLKRSLAFMHGTMGLQHSSLIARFHRLPVQCPVMVVVLSAVMTESAFARRARARRSHLFDDFCWRYPAVSARTGSCARPRSSLHLGGLLRCIIFAGCCEPLLHQGPSRHYPLRICSLHAWTPTPVLFPGARARFFPGNIGLPDIMTGSAPHPSPLSDFRAAHLSGLQSFADVQACTAARHPGRSHRGISAGQPWLLHPSTLHVVTFVQFGYACRPNRAIDGRGLSPHKIHSLVGCSHNVMRLPT